MRLPVHGGREVAWRKKPAAEQNLFVFPIEDEDSHDQVLSGSEHRAQAGLLAALWAGQLLPHRRMTANFDQGFVQTRKQ